MDKQRNIDQLFRLAQQDQTLQSFEKTKDRFVSSVDAASVKNTKTKQVFTKKWIIMLTTVSTIGLSLILLFSKKENNPSQPKAGNTSNKQTISYNKYEETGGKELQKTASEVTFVKPISLIAELQELASEIPFPINNRGMETAEEDSHVFKPAPPKLWDEPYQFPVLTEEEIAITKKKKKVMLKALAKHDKDAYAYIPSGSFDYNGKMISVQAFYMGTTEVTNFEYRTFLFDLIIQGRKEEFLKAKPDQSQWNKLSSSPNQGFVDHYFSHPAYNDYPVVNISREGVELYCKWLSQEVRNYVSDKKEGNYNDVRLPVRAEWVKAASNEGKQLPYPWGGPFTRNSKGWILANYLRVGEEALQSTQGTRGMDITAPSKSYWPNERGIYNLSGNVAEMVYEGMDKTEPGTAGGSWRNTEEEIKIYAPDPYKGITDPKPMIGFRVVSTYLVLEIKAIKTGN